jgi:hypothetical protein
LTAYNYADSGIAHPPGKWALPEISPHNPELRITSVMRRSA